jgi:hypothetical protein
MTALFGVTSKAFISEGRQVAAVQINKLVPPSVGCPEDGSSSSLVNVCVSTYDELHDVRSLMQAVVLMVSHEAYSLT